MTRYSDGSDGITKAYSSGEEKRACRRRMVVFPVGLLSVKARSSLVAVCSAMFAVCYSTVVVDGV